MISKSFNLLGSLNSVMTDSALSIITGTYDQTKTNLFNRAQARSGLLGTTLTGLGISPVNFLSTQDLSGTPNPVAHGDFIEPVFPSYEGKVIIPLTPAAASIPCALFKYNIMTDVWTYVGKLTLTLPTATVHTVRAIRLDDNAGSTTGWSVHLLTTNATAANGGYFYAPNLAQADFTVGGGTVIASATTGDTQASKKVFFVQETGGTNLLTVGLGVAHDVATKTMYVGSATTNTIFYKFIYSTAITSVTAGGVTSDLFSFKTGTHAGFGTLLQTNNMKIAIPKTSQNPSLIGQKCIYIGSATAGFHFLASDLSSGSTTTPSVVTWNRLGTGTDYSAPTWANCNWSNELDCEINYAASGVWMIKKAINNDPNIKMFGSNDPLYSEVAGSKAPDDFTGLATAGIFTGSGILFATSTTAGQRGMYALNIAGDSHWALTETGITAPSFVVTPVLSLDCAKAMANAIIAEYRIGGSAPIIQYKTSGFATWQSGWATLPSTNKLDSVGGLANISQVQYRILFSNMNDYNTTAQLVNEIVLSYIGKYENSEHWRLQVDNTSRNGDSPVVVAFKQVKAYAVSQAAYLYLYDSAGSLITSVNTSTHYSQFKKSTDGGATFSAMTGPNDYTNSGSGNTVIQFNWAAPVAGVTVAILQDS